MVLFLIGIALVVFAKNVAELFPYNPAILRFARLAGVGLAVIGLITATVVQIDAGHVGVQSLFGKVQERVLTSGLNVVNPLVKVNMFDVKTQNYTMSSVSTEGDKTGDDAIRVLSGDGLEVIIDLTILYSVVPSEAPTIYKR